MKRLFSNLIAFVSALIILAFICYSVTWVYVSRRISETLDDIWTHQDQYLISISGNEPSVTGFPAPPRFTFAGSLTDRNGVVYASPEFVFKGFPFETQALTLSAPQGLDLSGPVFKRPVHLDNFLLKLRIPRGFPDRFDRATLLSWQKRGGALPIERIHVSRASLQLDGDGFLNLDTDLQLAGLLTAKISGLDDLLNEMAASKTIGDKQALMGQSLLNLMSQKDEQTGASVVNTKLAVQDGGIFIGPFRAASFPKWKWDK